MRPSGAFRLSGTITAAQGLHERVSKPNAVLLITAANGGGVAVAVKRVVNPVLPLHYSITTDDLALPGPVWNGPLQVAVSVNRHGQVGVTRQGDMSGTHRGEARSGDRHVNIVIDTQH